MAGAGVDTPGASDRKDEMWWSNRERLYRTAGDCDAVGRSFHVNIALRPQERPVDLQSEFWRSKSVLAEYETRYLRETLGALPTKENVALVRRCMPLRRARRAPMWGCLGGGTDSVHIYANPAKTKTKTAAAAAAATTQGEATDGSGGGGSSGGDSGGGRGRAATVGRKRAPGARASGRCGGGGG